MKREERKLHRNKDIQKKKKKNMSRDLFVILKVYQNQTLNTNERPVHPDARKMGIFRFVGFFFFLNSENNRSLKQPPQGCGRITTTEGFQDAIGQGAR